jgi:hypothetical protein
MVLQPSQHSDMGQAAGAAAPKCESDLGPASFGSLLRKGCCYRAEPNEDRHKLLGPGHLVSPAASLRVSTANSHTPIARARRTAIMPCGSSEGAFRSWVAQPSGDDASWGVLAPPRRTHDSVRNRRIPLHPEDYFPDLFFGDLLSNSESNWPAAGGALTAPWRMISAALSSLP